MKKTVTIDKLTTKNVETKDGVKEKWVVQFKEKEGVWLEAWKGKWNSGWRLGVQVEIDFDTQLEKKEWKGKTYFRLSAPPEARGSFVDMKPITEAIADLQRRVSALEVGSIDVPVNDITPDF